MFRRRILSTQRPLVAALSALTLIAVLSACHDSGPPLPTAAVPVRPEADVAISAAPTKDIRPTGKGIGVQGDLSAQARSRYRVEYHAGPIMTGTPGIYVIFYGNWTSAIADGSINIYSDFISNVGGSPYFQTANRYGNQFGQTPSGAVLFGGSVVDAFSHGTVLSDADVADIVAAHITSNSLPQDPGGIYVIMASPEVTASSGLGVSYCAMHGTTEALGSSARYVFVGSPARSPAKCAPQAIGPNGTLNADAAVSLMAGEIFNVITDPAFGAWYDRSGLEPGDKCAWTFGTTYRAPNGALANVRLAERHYLLQQLWLPTKTGGGRCTLQP
jgi:hypothetical protein